jgi:hypothetical protein
MPYQSIKNSSVVLLFFVALFGCYPSKNDKESNKSVNLDCKKIQYELPIKVKNQIDSVFNSSDYNYCILLSDSPEFRYTFSLGKYNGFSEKVTTAIESSKYFVLLDQDTINVLHQSDLFFTELKHEALNSNEFDFSFFVINPKGELLELVKY